MTVTSRMVLEVFLGHPDRELYGLGIRDATELSSATIYPILERLKAAGWLTSRLTDPADSRRPQRRYYRLTPAGQANGAEMLAARARHRIKAS